MDRAPGIKSKQSLTSVSNVGFASSPLDVAIFTSRVVSLGLVLLVHKRHKVSQALTLLTLGTGNLGDLKILAAIGSVNAIGRGILGWVDRVLVVAIATSRTIGEGRCIAGLSLPLDQQFLMGGAGQTLGRSNRE